jgi:ATP-dependent Clp protease ATP-binding subunit ClpB
VDFRNTVVIMTSNVGSPHILESARAGRPVAAVREEVLGLLQQQFRPEFLNRVDDIIVFHALDEAQVAKIADVQLDRLRERLSDRRIQLELSTAALAHLARIGFDPVFGARPLKRALQQHLETPLAKRILAGDVNDGDTVVVEPGAAGFQFQVRRSVAAASN